MAAPTRMRAFERRRLSAAEQTLGRTMFNEEIGWSAVRVWQAPKLGFGAMVPAGRTIVFSKWNAARDFSVVETAEQGWFVHELAHVWQAARGVFLACAKLGALGDGAYRYEPKANSGLAQYNIESQAEIARHLFLARAGAPAPHAPPRDWLEAVWARR